MSGIPWGIAPTASVNTPRTVYLYFWDSPTSDSYFLTVGCFRTWDENLLAEVQISSDNIHKTLDWWMTWLCLPALHDPRTNMISKIWYLLQDLYHYSQQKRWEHFNADQGLHRGYSWSPRIVICSFCGFPLFWQAESPQGLTYPTDFQLTKQKQTYLCLFIKKKTKALAEDWEIFPFLNPQSLMI